MLVYAWGIISNTGSVVYHSGGLGWVIGSAAVSTVLAGVSLVRGNYSEAALSAAGAALTLRDEAQAVMLVATGGLPALPLVVVQQSTSHASKVITHAGLVVGNAVGLGVELGGMVYSGAALIFRAVRPVSSESQTASRENTQRGLRALTY